jgi:hypothetical protein
MWRPDRGNSKRRQALDLLRVGDLDLPTARSSWSWTKRALFIDWSAALTGWPKAATRRFRPRNPSTPGRDRGRLHQLTCLVHQVQVQPVARQRWWSGTWRGGSRAGGGPGAAPAGGQHPTDLGSGQGVGAVMGSRGAVGQSGLTPGSGRGPATCRRSPATPQALRRLGRGPAQLGDALDQQQPTELGQPRISMGHEGPLPARCFDNPSRSRGPSTVNNARGNYT